MVAHWFHLVLKQRGYGNPIHQELIIYILASIVWLTQRNTVSGHEVVVGLT
jgi:hypothetical protein